jgi:hypothetical protein
MLGNTSGLTAPFVQLASDLESDRTRKDINQLIDPISNLHPDIRILSKNIYKELINTDNGFLRMNDAFFQKFLQPLTILESKDAIKLRKNINATIPQGIFFKDPGYILYLCKLYADPKTMQSLFEKIENCRRGDWMCSKKLKEELKLPVYVIEQVFRLYASKGLGLLSEPVGQVRYMSKT